MATEHKVLIIDDDEFVLLSIKLLLESNQLKTFILNTPERIPAMLAKEKFDAILLDMNFRQGDTSSTQGLFWLNKIKERSPDVPVILMTAFGEIPLAVEAMKCGADDFVTKPWHNDKLVSTIKNSIRKNSTSIKVDKKVTAEVKRIATKNHHELIGNSPYIQQIKKLIDKIAPTDTAVLILGSNGTGKEVIAREIHKKSNRSENNFISVDVGSLSETIFESELFGHKKGAFTDAKEDRPGRIESASGGTLFLDEIGNLSPSLQSKLLTVLQNKQITRLGSNTPVDVDVRIICATNSNIKKMVSEGKFREDLYYRINTVEITLPALQERPADIPLLIDYFLRRFKTKYEKTDRIIPAPVMETLQKYHWPGNIRELQHSIERAVILSESTELKPEDFGIIRSENSGELVFDHLNLEKLEEWAIRKAIQKHKGNVSHAADELGLSRGALYRRMEKYGI